MLENAQKAQREEKLFAEDLKKVLFYYILALLFYYVSYPILTKLIFSDQ